MSPAFHRNGHFMCESDSLKLRSRNNSLTQLSVQQGGLRRPLLQTASPHHLVALRINCESFTESVLCVFPTCMDCRHFEEITCQLVFYEFPKDARF